MPKNNIYLYNGDIVTESAIVKSLMKEHLCNLPYHLGVFWRPHRVVQHAGKYYKICSRQPECEV
jgi:hypothetical protein